MGILLVFENKLNNFLFFYLKKPDLVTGLILNADEFLLQYHGLSTLYILSIIEKFSGGISDDEQYYYK